MQHTQTEITADSSNKAALLAHTPSSCSTPCKTLPPSNLPPAHNPPACGSSAAGLEGRLLEGLALGPLALLEQRQRISGTEFRLVMPADIDAVIDLCIAAGMQAPARCCTLCRLALGLVRQKHA